MRDSDTKSRILEASIDLFYQHGFVKASMREIARKADITLSSSYNHFKDKYDILYTIIMDIGTALLNAMDAATVDMPRGIETLRALITAQLCLIEHRAKEIKVYLEEQYQLPQEARSVVLAQHRTVYNRYYQEVAAMEEQGLLKDINKTVITFSIIAMINWAYRWYQNNGELSMTRVAQDILKICFGGIIEDSFRRALEAPRAEKDLYDAQCREPV